ncbi:proteoglycan 4-like [Ostrea edulis]|uniref:proteoglycan 4-like n=1 Tax=Ostrea edulis TaxID=37623 RepID=UPI0024AF2ABD|nr:proteoglycan 4-like [Ostrea edulis]
MKKLLRTLGALIFVSVITESHTYGAEESVYQQIAKALWQLQMKGDIEKALGNTDVWSSVQGNAPSDSRIHLADAPKMRPTTVQPITAKTKRAAFARRETTRQVTNRPAPTISQAMGQDQIAPGSIYTNKINRATARGYGSSLTKLIASKIKFNPAPEPKVHSNPTIDSILGPIAQGSNNRLPSNFIPIPPTLTINVAKVKNTPMPSIPKNTKSPQPTFDPEVKSNPVLMIHQIKKSDVPSPSFSVDNTGQQPASFRFTNKEVKNNQLNDKGGNVDKSGFVNDFKDFEINDAPQVIVEQALTTSKPVVVKKQDADSKHKGMEIKTAVIKPIPHKHSLPSKSDILIDDIPVVNQHKSDSRPAVLGAEITRQEITKPEIQIVNGIQRLEPFHTPHNVTRSLQSVNISETNGTSTKDLPVHAPTFTTEPSTLTTKEPPKTTTQPFKADIPRGSPWESRSGNSRGSFRNTRPTGRGIRPSGRGFSLSRGSRRGSRTNTIGGPASRRTVNIPKRPLPPWATDKNSETTTKKISSTQSTTMPSTKKEENQLPAMNTAQFARRGGSKRVVVNRGNTNNVKTTNPRRDIVTVTETNGTSTMDLPARSPDLISEPSTLTTKKPATSTTEPNNAEVPRKAPLEPRSGSSGGSFRNTRPTGRGIRPSGRGFSLSRGSRRGSRTNTIGSPASRRTVNIPKRPLPSWATDKNSETTTKKISSTQSTTMPSTKKEKTQLPEMNTAQFARRGGSKHVVVNSGDTDNIRPTNPRREIVTVKESIGKSTVDLSARSPDLRTEPSTLTTKEPATITSEPIKAEVSRQSPWEPRSGSSKGSFRNTRPTGRGIRPSGRGFSLSRGSRRGSRTNTIGGPASRRTVNISKRPLPPWATDKNSETTTKKISSTQSTTMPSTTKEENQLPAMNTAQFARRGGSKRVVVNRGSSNNPKSVDSRRGGGIVISMPNERLPFTTSSTADEPMGASQNTENEQISPSVILQNSEISTGISSSSVTTTTTTQIWTTQSSIRATTDEQRHQGPAMNTAQFARRGGSRRVLVNRGNTSNMGNITPRSEVELVQTVIATNNDVLQSPDRVMSLNSETSSRSTSRSSTASTTTVQPPATITTPTVATTRRVRMFRPGMMSPEDKRSALRNFQG